MLGLGNATERGGSMSDPYEDVGATLGFPGGVLLALFLLVVVIVSWETVRPQPRSGRRL
jgi:hypothetical protein